MNAWVVFFNQLIAYILLYIPVNFFLKLKPHFQLDFKELHKGVILTANHQSTLDVFAIYGAMPLIQYIKLLPVYALVTHKYMNTWWKKTILGLVGCHPLDINPKGSAKALLFVLDKIDKGYPILFFPEGGLMREEEIGKTNPGIGYLALKRNIDIIPIHLSGFRNVNLVNLLLRRYQAHVFIGKPLKFFGIKKKVPEKVSEIILEHIYKLT